MIIKHSLYYIIARGFPSIIGFLTITIFTHILLPEEYGQYVLVLAAVEVIYVVLFQWIQLGILRYFPYYEDQESTKLLSTVAVIYLVLVLITGIIFFAILFFSVDVKVSRPILYIGLVLLWSISLYRMNLDIARSKLSPKRYGILASLKAVIALSLGTLLVFFGAGAKGVLVGLILGFIFPSFWMIIKEWYIVRRRYFDKNILLQLVKYGIPLITSFALNAVIHSSDRIMLGWIIGKSDAGLYSSGYNIAQQILIFSMSTINLAAYPIVVRSLEKKRLAETDKNLSMYFTILIGIALPITVGLSLLSKDISNIFLGQAYREAANRLIPWISIGIFFMGIRAFYTDMAFQLGKRTIGQASVLFIAAFVNIVLNILWIPNLGMIGAAYSTVLSCAIALFLSWFVGKKIFYLPFPFRDIFKIIFATFFMTFSLYLTSSMEGILGFVAKISIGILTYAICSILLNVGGVKKYLHTNIPLLNKSKN